ncbi:hypothetical protein [Zobellella maritima]|uniref:hypothetical protein n=1 Tax=Zobellella maritima TaxID=2059725 RepID=UPI0013008EA6|nr:hypothetical protein [Zobellella maritima]
MKPIKCPLVYQLMALQLLELTIYLLFSCLVSGIGAWLVIAWHIVSVMRICENGIGKGDEYAFNTNCF